MKWKDRFRFIRQNMKKNRSRVAMTMLATAIGCAFLIILASVGIGAQKYIVDDLMKDRAVTEVSIFGKSEVAEGENPALTQQDVDRLEELDGVKAVSRSTIVENPAVTKLGDYEVQPSVEMVDFNSEKKAGLKLAEGRMPAKENEVLVGYHFDKLLVNQEEGADKELYDSDGLVKKQNRYDEPVLGKSADIEIEQIKEGERVTNMYPVTIVGVAEEPARDWEVGNEVLISESMLEKIEAFTGTKNGAQIQTAMSDDEIALLQDLNEPRSFSEVNVIAGSLEQVENVTEELKKEGYNVYSVTEQIDEVNVVFAVIKTGLVIIGTIALLIASIGIFNTMSMAVTERTQDIGIMKAIGGHPKMIRSIFLMESGCIGLIGALAGVLAAYAVSIGINFILPLVMKQVFEETPEAAIQLSFIPPYLAVACVILSIGIAMISGWKPANKATRIDVLRALRRDI